MTIGLLRRIAPQPICALVALSLPFAATAGNGADSRRVAEAKPTEKSAAFAGSTGSLKTADTAVTAASPAALGGDVLHTRFLIGLPKEVEYRVFSLANPNRVIVDISSTSLRLPPQPQENIAVGLVRSFHAGASGPGKSRVVIEVIRPVVVDGANIITTEDGKGHRLALDIVPVNPPTGTKKLLKTASLSSLGVAVDVQPPLPTPAMRPDQMAARTFKPIIVIDPGHGGDDSGAMKNGVVEKSVVLAFSLMLRDKLEKTGRFKVMMTRDTDVFVPLDKRVDYAEQHKANLFIAVHADYAGGNSKARGATIYSLRENVANALQRSAKGEVKGAVLTKDEVEGMKSASLGTDVSAVKDILADLAGREVDATQERTSIFTRSVIEYMGASTELRAKPDQQAAFRVLKTAQFPSVLIELAYVTNKQDAALLASDAWRDKVSDSIMTAIDNYFGNQIARLPM